MVLYTVGLLNTVAVLIFSKLWSWHNLFHLTVVFCDMCFCDLHCFYNGFQNLEIKHFLIQATLHRLTLLCLLLSHELLPFWFVKQKTSLDACQWSDVYLMIHTMLLVSDICCNWRWWSCWFTLTNVLRVDRRFCFLSLTLLLSFVTQMCHHLSRFVFRMDCGYTAYNNVLPVLLWLPYGIGQAIIFLPCGFYLSIFFPRLISAAADWMSTVLLHVVWPYCEFRMQVWNVLHTACCKCRTQKRRQELPSGHHRTTLSGYIFATKAILTIEKKTY